MISFNLPRDTETPVRFFGYFTAQEVGRLTTPLAITGFYAYQPSKPVATVVGLSLGLVIGAAWIAIRIEGQTLDMVLFHALRQEVTSRFTEPPKIQMVEDQYAVTEQGTAVAAVKIQPVPLSMQSTDDQNALHSVLKDLYETVSFSVEVHSRQLPLSLDSYIQALEENGDSESRTSYADFCRELNKGDANTTHHYITLQTKKPGASGLRELLATAADEWGRWDELLTRIEGILPFDPLELSTGPQPRLSELEHRTEIVLDRLNRGSLEAERVTGTEFRQYINSFKHRIEPGKTSYQVPGAPVGEYRKLVYVVEFPATGKLGWTVEILNQNSPGGIDVIQRVEPRNQSKAVRSLERRIDRLEAEINSRLGGGLIKDVVELEKRQDDARSMVELCADNTQSLVQYSVYLVAHGNTPEERDAAYNEAITRLDTMLADHGQTWFRNDHAHRTESLLHADPLDQGLLMPSSSAAAGFPFATTNRNDGRGVIYGTSTEDQSPILLDIWNWSSYASAILGKTGSGKSYFVKLLLHRWTLAYNLEQTIIVDPKTEYSHLIEQLGGTTRTLNENTSNSFEQDVVGFQVPDRGNSANTDLLIQLIRDIYSATSQNRNRTIVVIDEAHNILRSKEGRQVLEQFVREARDTQTAVVMISQNADDFASNLEGRNILKNTAATFLMRHSDVAEDVTQFFQLSTQENVELQKLKTGTEARYSEALMKISDRLDTKVRIEATPWEHQTITGDDQE